MNSLTDFVKNGKLVNYKSSISSIYDRLLNHAESRGDRAAIIGVDMDTRERVSLSYSRLFPLVTKTANFLTSLGIKENDRFAILMPNCPETLLLELAAGFIGAATVPLDFKRDTYERKLFKIQDTSAKVLIVKAESETEDLKKLSQKVKLINFSTFQEFEKLISSQPDELLKPPIISLNSLYVILYTSGTTALPKGVPLTAKALIANAEGIAKWQNLTSQDRFNIILPLHHINSTSMSMATLLASGTVIINSRYSASRFWKIISQEKCTITSVVPTIIHDLLVRVDEFSEIKNLSLKRILVGSAPVLPEETLRFYKTFGVRVIQGYGQTETALRVTGVPIDLNEKEYLNSLRSNTIGVELLNNNVAIIKSDGSEADEKEEGEICIRGPVLAEGYWRNIEATKEAFYDGWFHSGDLGYYELKNGQKYFYIIGRLKEIIIKGGINLSPAFIEDALLNTFPEIDEVSVVGYPDDRMGEEIAAVIVPKKGFSLSNLSDLSNLILQAGQTDRIKGLSHYEAPKKVFIVDSLPKTSTGKIQRVEVKKTIAALYRPESAPPAGGWRTKDPQRTKPTFKILEYAGVDDHKYYVRQIKQEETEVLQKALTINNQRWQGLPATLRKFSARAQNGLLFGVFEENEGLVGSISCLRLNLGQVKQLKIWNEATANGTLSNHDHDADTILCVAISITLPNPPLQREGIPPLLKRGSGGVNNVTMKQFSNSEEASLKQLAQRHIEAYVNSNQDHVLNFHRKPKGGLPGATVWKILENGRPEDKDSMGYNVLMKYPDITPTTKIIHSANTTPSIILIEHVLSYAKKQGIPHIIAFSRPAGYRNYLLQKSF